jgi:hypothetical protein
MSPRLLADLLVVVHLLFIAFAVFGGAFALRWPKAAWLHLPALAWAVWIEATGGTCPLTPLENRLRAAGGEAGYAGSFVDHYLLPIVYPAGLTREWQWALAALLVAINAEIYGAVLRRLRTRRRD